MTYPSNLSTLTATHKVVSASGRPLRGNVYATPPKRVWATEGSIVDFDDAKVPIQPDGTYAIKLPHIDQGGILNPGKPWKITEDVPGEPRSFWVAPMVAMGTGTVDITTMLTDPPSGQETVVQAGPVTDEAAAGLLAKPGGAFRTSLTTTIAAEVEQKAGNVPTFGSQAEALQYEADNPGRVALWFDAGYTEVTPTGPTWTDSGLGGGTWTTPTEPGVTYTPASGTAAAGQVVTVVATAKPGYALVGTKSWTHTFRQPAAAYFANFAGDAINTTPAGWTPRLAVQPEHVWQVREDLNASHGKALMGARTLAGSARRAITLDAASTDPDRADLEVFMRARQTNGSGQEFRVGALLRGSGDAATLTGLVVGSTDNPGDVNRIVLLQYVNGVATELADGPRAGDNIGFYRLRVRATGNRVQARWWVDGPEPTTWQIDHTGVTVLGPGWVGGFMVHNLNCHIDEFGVGMAGKAAPTGPVA